MSDNKMGPNIQAGAGFLAKRVQKSLNRAQEKVLQRLGKAMETKDEQFEQCSQSLNKQQADGSRLFKDVRAYHSAVKVMHESSKRLSQTLKDIYESDWDGGEDLSVIKESEDLLWNDYEEKISDQIVRTMENYTSQFPEVKERVSKRGRKLVDYDSARHHLEALQSAKKKDDGKLVKAEEEFNKAQNVFEEMNKELREELPVLYQSRIGCYVTVFQNISNLRDVFYKEMSVLNHELYNVMKKLETQHSAKTFVIKGLNSTKSKKRKSLVISNPIPCNTAFPADHVSMRSDTQNGSEANPSVPGPAPCLSEGSASSDSGVPCKNATDSDDLSSAGSTGASTPPKRQSLCGSEASDRSTEAQPLEEAEEEAEKGAEEEAEEEAEEGAEEEAEEEAEEGAEEGAEEEAEEGTSQSEDAGEGGPVSEAATDPEASCPVVVATGAPTQCPARGNVAEAKPPPVPAPRVSSFSSVRKPTIHAGEASPEEDEEAEPPADQGTNGNESHSPPDVMPKQDDIVNSGLEEGSDQNTDTENHSGSTTESHSEPVQAE